MYGEGGTALPSHLPCAYKLHIFNFVNPFEPANPSFLSIVETVGSGKHDNISHKEQAGEGGGRDTRRQVTW